jgi:deoxycytidine triphosphate deaminase
MELTTITLHTEFQIFATNRSLMEPASVHVRIADRTFVALGSADLLTGPDAKTANSFEQPDLVRSRSFIDSDVNVRIAQSDAYVELPPLSAAAMTFRVSNRQASPPRCEAE